MTISNEDVQDILRLLDTLPFSELTLETGRFTLRLQRAADGGWSQETQVLSRPVAAAGPAAAAGPVPAVPAAAALSLSLRQRDATERDLPAIG